MQQILYETRGLNIHPCSKIFISCYMLTIINHKYQCQKKKKKCSASKEEDNRDQNDEQLKHISIYKFTEMKEHAYGS